MAAQNRRLDGYHESVFWHGAFGRCGVAIKPHPAADGYPDVIVAAGDPSSHAHAMEKALAGRRTAYSN